MKQNNKTLWVWLFAGAILIVWVALKVAPHFSEGIFSLIIKAEEIFKNPLSIQWCDSTLKAIACFLFIYIFCITLYLSSRRNYRKKEEYGSATWGNTYEICNKYRNRKQPFANRILSKNLKIALDDRYHRRNLNTLVIGGSGSGKSRGYAKPQLLNGGYTSFIVLDSKGELLRDTGEFLRKQGYKIRVLDLLEMHKSHCYNPFVYLEDDNDVMRLVTNIIENTTPQKSSNADPFWEKSETALLEALIFYLVYKAPRHEQNFSVVMEMLASAEVREDDEDFESPLDILFERFKMEEPDNIAVRQYDIFKLAAGKTAKSILVSLAVRLEKFSLLSLQELTARDDMKIEKLGEELTAIFCIIPDNDTSFNFVVGTLYTLAFQKLFRMADKKYGGRLPIPVHFLMDEAMNVALPSNFRNLVSVVRSRGIQISLICQNISDIKANYQKEWESIIGNCDTLVYLGGNEQSTHEYISKTLGKETIDTNTYGLSKGRSGSYSTNYQQTGRELMTPDEIRKLDNNKSIVLIRGEKPVLDDKYDLLKHPFIKHTPDGGGKIYEHGKIHFSRTVLQETDIDDNAIVGIFTPETFEQYLQQKEI